MRKKKPAQLDKERRARQKALAKLIRKGCNPTSHIGYQIHQGFKENA